MVNQTILGIHENFSLLILWMSLKSIDQVIHKCHQTLKAYNKFRYMIIATLIIAA